MSTLNIHDLQGISAYSNVIRVPTGHSLNTVGNISTNKRELQKDYFDKARRQ